MKVGGEKKKYTVAKDPKQQELRTKADLLRPRLIKDPKNDKKTVLLQYPSKQMLKKHWFYDIRGKQCKKSHWFYNIRPKK